MTIEIRQIEPDQISEAKRVILSVARNIFQWQAPLEEIITQFDERGELRDVDDLKIHYLDCRGLFLVALDQGRVIGTGAIRQINYKTAELKRLWLLEAYHGLGIGYRLVQELLTFAKAEGYEHIRLLTDRRQARAMHFYQQVGFYAIPCDSEDPADACMELKI